MKKIELNGNYVIELSKPDHNNELFWHFSILQKHQDGTVTPICDAPVTLIQNNDEMGFEFDLESKNIFLNQPLVDDTI